MVDPPYNASYCGFNDAPGCLPLNGCGVISVFPLLILFTMVTTFVGLNLFVGVVLSEFENLTHAEVSSDDLNKFAALWVHYDPKATYYMDVRDVEHLVANLFAPLGFAGEPYTAQQMRKRIGR